MKLIVLHLFPYRLLQESMNRVLEGLYVAGHLLSNATHLEETFTCRKPPTFEYGCLTNEKYGICRECGAQGCPQEEHTIACNVIDQIDSITPHLRNLRHKIEEMVSLQFLPPPTNEVTGR